MADLVGDPAGSILTLHFAGSISAFNVKGRSAEALLKILEREGILENSNSKNWVELHHEHISPVGLAAGLELFEKLKTSVRRSFASYRLLYVDRLEYKIKDNNLEIAIQHNEQAVSYVYDSSKNLVLVTVLPERQQFTYPVAISANGAVFCTDQSEFSPDNLAQMWLQALFFPADFPG